MSKLETRVERLEAQTPGDQVIVVQRGQRLTVSGEEITLDARERLRETHDVCLIVVTRDGNDTNKTGGLT